MFKFFRNADAAEVVAAPEVVETVVQDSPLPDDYMAQFAKSARTVQEGEDVPEYKAEEPAPTIETPAVAADEPKVEVAAEPAAPIEEPKVETQPIAAEIPKETSWKEHIQKEPPAAILKELGYDERMVNFLEHWRNGGDIKEYLKEAATDYQTMDAVELMMHQLRLDYPKASEAQLEVLFDDKVLQRYKQTEDFTETEKERGKLLLDAEADKFRDDFTLRQQQKLLPPAPEKVEASNEPDPQVVEHRQLVDDSRKSILESPYYKKVLSDNKLSFGEGDEAFSFPVDAGELPDILYNGEKFVQSMFKVGESNGKTTLEADPEHQMLVAATAKHGKSLFVALAKHFKAIGSKKAIDVIDNPSTPIASLTQTPFEQQPQTEAGMLAKYGVVK